MKILKISDFQIICIMVLLVRVLIVLLAFQSVENMFREAKDYEQYSFVGIFAACHPDYMDEYSMHRNDMILMAHETMAKNFRKFENFRAFKVCNDTDLLVGILTSLFLNVQYQYPASDENGDARHSNLVFIAAFVTPEQSKLIGEIGSASNALKVCQPVPCEEKLVRPTLSDSSRWLMTLLDTFQWQKVNLISIYDGIADTFPYHNPFFNQTYALLREQEKFCLTGKIFDLNSFMNIDFAKIDFEIDPIDFTEDPEDPFELAKHEYFRQHFYDTILPYLRKLDADSVTIVFGKPSRDALFKQLHETRTEFENYSFIFNDFTQFAYENVPGRWMTSTVYLRPEAEISFNHSDDITEYPRLMLSHILDLILEVLKADIHPMGVSENHIITELSKKFLGNYDVTFTLPMSAHIEDVWSVWRSGYLKSNNFSKLTQVSTESKL